MIRLAATPTVPSHISVDPADQACQTADECVYVGTDCSGCECGTPVNVIHRDKYNRLYRAACVSYHGPVCEMNCPPAQLQCINRVCTVVLATPAP